MFGSTHDVFFCFLIRQCCGRTLAIESFCAGILRNRQMKQSGMQRSSVQDGIICQKTCLAGRRFLQDFCEASAVRSELDLRVSACVSAKDVVESYYCNYLSSTVGELLSPFSLPIGFWLGTVSEASYTPPNAGGGDCTRVERVSVS